jgi:hypothetical protein
MVDDIRNVVAQGVESGEVIIYGIGECSYRSKAVLLSKSADNIVYIAERGQIFIALDEGKVIKDKIIMEGIEIGDPGKGSENEENEHGISGFFYWRHSIAIF